MKILYIAPFDHTGYGQASLGYLKAMVAAGIDVVPRRLKYNNTPSPSLYNELASKNTSDCNILIQHTLPEHFVYNASYYNVGMFASESDISPFWVDCLNMMDLVVVFNKHSQTNCLNAGVVKPVVVWPHAFDMAELEKAKLAEKIVMPPLVENTFKFLYAGEFNQRKNLSDLIRAFHLEFNYDEPVSLIIKTTKGDFQNEEMCYAALQSMIDQIKTGLNKYQDKTLYRQEIVAVEDLPRERLLQLYNTVDCFVSASYGEAWGIPGFECAALGKPIICSYLAAPYQMDNDLFNVIEEVEWLPVTGVRHQHGYWARPLLSDLMTEMRYAYKNSKNCSPVIKYDYSYTAIGALIKNTLKEFSR